MKKVSLLIFVSMILLLAFSSCTLAFQEYLPGGNTTEDVQGGHTHVFTDVWKTDAICHYHECECGAREESANHVDENLSGRCDVCNAEVPLPTVSYTITVKATDEEGKLFFGNTIVANGGEDAVFNLIVGVEYVLNVGDGVSIVDNKVEDGARIYTIKVANVAADMTVAITSAICAHEWKPATCTEDAVCKLCTLVGESALGHNYGAEVTAPTCTADGYTTHTCSRCDDTYTDSTVPALGHSYGSVVTDPTCTEGGYTTYTCSVCGDSYTADQTEAKGHSYGSVVTDPTCTEGGYTTYTCSVCGNSYTADQTEANGHSYGSVVTDPTCTEGGYTTYTCSVCGDSYVADHTDPNGHTEQTREENNVGSTCGESGSYDVVTYCTVCNVELDRDTVVTDKLPHRWTDATCQAPKTCSVCGATEGTVAEHKAGEVKVENRVDPDCENAGSYDNATYCVWCNIETSRQTVSVDALGHAIVPHDAKAATCTEIGWKAYETCSRCNHTTYSEIEALGHTDGTPVKENNVDATCTTAGGYDMVTYCTVCNAVTNTAHTDVDALGHTDGTPVKENNVDATCTTAGGYDMVTYCTVCKAVTNTAHTDAPALGHTDGTPVKENNVDATCTTAGGYDTVIYCTVCEAEVSRVHTEIAATGHDEISHEAQAPTCTVDGHKAYVTCSLCDYTTYEVDPATGHDYDETVTAPTCSAEGYTTYVCHCGDTYTGNTVAKIPHAWVSNGIGADCANCDATATVNSGWQLITDASELKAGMQIIIVDKDGKVALSTTQNPNNRGTAAVTNDSNTVTIGSDVQIITIKAGKTSGTFALYVGNGYLYAASSSSNYLRTETTLSANSSWNITITSAGIATIKATGTNTRNLLKYNSSNKIFACYASGQTDVCIYALVTNYVECTEHNFVEKVVTAPNCTETGISTKYCTKCGYEDLTEITVDALGHNEITHEAKAPTCTADGYKAYVTCSRCDYTTYEVDPSAGHAYGELHEAVGATCQHAGNIAYYQCSVCECFFDEAKNDIEEDEITIDIVDHSFTNNACIWCGTSQCNHDNKTTTTIAPTCTEAGKIIIECDDCEYYREELPGDAATGHSHTLTSTVAPTCTTDGSKTYTCHCGDTYNETVDATGHSWNGADCDNCDATRPTITFKVNGKVVKTMYGDSIEMHTPDGIDGFTFYGWTTAESVNEVSTAPTVEKAGATVSITADTTYNAVFSFGNGKSYKKTNISNIESNDVVVITMTSGSNVYALYNANGTSSAPTAVVVTVSGDKITSDVADNIKWNISNSNGTLTIYPNGTTSKWLYCTNTNNGVRVGANKDLGCKFKIDAASGYLISIGTDDTRYIGVYNAQDWRCYTNTTGNIANQTLAFYVYVEDLKYTTNACAHTETTTTTNPATCVDTGSTVVTCADCGKIISTATIPATGEHTYENGECTVCGNPDPSVCTHEGTETTTTTTAATCVNAGKTVITCQCGEVISETPIPATGVHTYKDGKCTVCNADDPNYKPAPTISKATSIAVGDVVYLVCESKGMELSSISTTSTKYGIGVAYTGTPAGAMKLTVVAGSTSGTYAFKTEDGKYLYWTSGNSLATDATLNANTSWTVTFSNGNAVIKNAKDSSRQIYWNASSPRFACYNKTGQTAVQLYKES